MKYFKNTSWLFFEKILRMAVGLFITVWMARYLGPEEFGLFSYAQSFVGLFLVVSTLGLDNIIVRELIKKSDRQDALIGTAFWLKLFGAFVVLVLLSVIIPFTSNDTETNILIFIIASATLFQSFNVIDFYFQSKVLSRFVVYANMISLAISSVLKIVLILNEAPLVAFAWVVLFDSMVLALGLVYFYRKNHNAFKFKNFMFQRAVALELLRDSWPFILSGGVLMIQARIDQVMIKEMLGATEVGYYSIALKLIEALGFVTMLIKSSLYPSIEYAKQSSTELYQNRLLNFYRLNFLLFLIVAIPVFIFSEQLVILIFGIKYQNAGILLALMAIRLFFTNMGTARGVFILTENLMRYSLISMILGTATNVVLNYFWIAEYGTQGAILATIVSFSVTIFLVDIFYRKTRNNVLLQFNAVLTFYKLKV